MTDREIQARADALGGVRSMTDWYKIAPNAQAKRFAQPGNDRVTSAINRAAGAAPASQGKVMVARFNSKCPECGGWINQGETIRFDGKAHHYPECPEPEGDFSEPYAYQRPADPRPRNEAERMWDAGDECRCCGADLTREGHRPNCENLPEPDFPDDEPAEHTQRDHEYAESHGFGSAEEMDREATENNAKLALPDGKLTLEFTDGHYRTFLIRTQKADAKFAPGERVVKYLAGPDNESDKSYVGFAFLKGDRLVIWKRFQGETQLTRDASVLLDPAKAAEYGLRYALSSGRCYSCGHELTVPASIHRGLGPDCAKRFGM